jgi:hypothetical protein
MDFEAPERRPNVVYIDQKEVNNDLIYDRQGEMREVIERENQEKQGEVEGEAGGTIPGLSTLRAAIRAHWKKGEESEFVTNLDHSAAKLALFLESVAEDDAGTVISEDFDEANREDIKEGDVIVVVGGLRRTPFQELKSRFEGGELESLKEAIQEFGKMESEIGSDAEELNKMETEMDGLESGLKGLSLVADAISAEKDLYRVRAAESNIDFVMELNEEKFKNRPFGFPDSKGSYYVVGKVQKKFREDQEIPLVWFDQLVNTDNPRKQRKKEVQKRMEIKDLAKDFVNNREIENSEFDISYPDIQIQPLIIYT